MLDAGYWMLDELGIHLFIYPVSSIQNPASRSLVGLRRSFSSISGSVQDERCNGPRRNRLYLGAVMFCPHGCQVFGQDPKPIPDDMGKTLREGPLPV
jgi:hypothetical protein